MTHFFPFSELTWPEVYDLSHATPLVLPLGRGYNLEKLAEMLGSPAQIGLLPEIPYGWTGSGLMVSLKSLETLVSNLLTSMRDDSFTRVYVLIPAGLDLGLDDNQLALPINPYGLPPSPLPGDEQRGKVILLPFGHTEQHGYHLPLSTDTCIIDAICQGTTHQIPGEAFSLPAFPYGVSTHRQSFAGTLNCGGRAFEDFVLEVIASLVGRGFDRFYVLSGHGGNSSFLVNIVKYAGERFPWIFCATAWLYLSGPSGIAALEKYRTSGIGGMGHAGELETSLMLALHPDLVHMERVVDETDFISTPSYSMDWVEGGSLVANPPWYDDTQTGAYGAGSLATIEKGRLWLDAAIQEKAGHVAEIHEQFKRRSARRLELSSQPPRRRPRKGLA